MLSEISSVADSGKIIYLVLVFTLNVVTLNSIAELQMPISLITADT